MKKYISIAALAMLALASCSKDTEGLTSTTYYAVIELDGPVYEQIATGTPFVDPGYSATMEGENITDQVKVTTSMDFQNPQPGYYTITYSAVNADGFTASATRYVLVADVSDKISGYYTTGQCKVSKYQYSGYPEVVWRGVSGTYHVSDLIGGFYQYFYNGGYGSLYALNGEIDIASDGTITLIDSYCEGFEDSASDLSDGHYDAATSTLSWNVDYAGKFSVAMTKDE